MRLAPEGLVQMVLSTLALGAGVWAAVAWWWPAAIPLLLVWGWSIAFFRDPKREANFAPGELCSPADGTVTDITRLDEYEAIEGPAVRVGIFLSLFDVHINRSPCDGTVTSTGHRKGRFVAAMKPSAGQVNESNTVVIEPASPLPGPVVVRQVAGMAARRIVCHAHKGSSLAIGQRFGMIKFGSRTELVVPALAGTQLLVNVGDKVRAGVTRLIRQPQAADEGIYHERRFENGGRAGAATAPAPA